MKLQKIIKSLFKSFEKWTNTIKNFISKVILYNAYENKILKKQFSVMWLLKKTKQKPVHSRSH